MRIKRYEIKIKGLVQGIGFRPFIYNLATQLKLNGWVNNSSEGVTIQIESNQDKLDLFIDKIKQEKPSFSVIDEIIITPLNYYGYQSFIIKKSEEKSKNITTPILPDLSTCNECLKELFDPQNRRYRYPFINCTNCGCRYSIIKQLPYDRSFTTMNEFKMCEKCEEEYKNPNDRRFHAQPNACEKCGPHIELWNKKGEVLAKFDQALITTCELIKTGNILAIKGLGGFHLVVSATDKSAVQKLRQLKNRPDKPFALMYPNLEAITQDCHVSETEKKLLLSPASPIVLLKRKKENNSSLICAEVAPDNPYLGVMLPYTPLHHLLLKELNFPIVATSGNPSNEPICIDEKQALKKLNFADYFLVHNRPIFRPVDDSIVRVIKDEIITLRCARGYAPLSLSLNSHGDAHSHPNNIIALGGHLKSTIALKINHQIFLSQYLGNLDSLENQQLFNHTLQNWQEIYHLKPDYIRCDRHPNYYSTNYAEALINSGKKDKNLEQKSLIKVQHHLAHIYSVIAEHQVQLPLLGIAWDGTGYGLDNTIWGGEFFYINNDKIQRIASFKPFPLLGGEKAIIEPKRITLALLYLTLNSDENINQLLKTLEINNYFTPPELKILLQMLEKNINSPLTSSVGRLFDGISCLLKPTDKITFEGQKAMELEYMTNDYLTSETYPFHWQYELNKCNYINWYPLIKNIIQDYQQKKPSSLISAKFHQTLIKIIVTISQAIDIKNIVLAGGCFQNKYLLENTINALEKEKFKPHWNQKIPLNDAGLAVGQLTINNLQLIMYS